ncbi:hypothetical protein [Nocardia yamanashiensis]|uniref:hypothetical protein n=1 Tax=Nocardia yamanashiensis TaxID=209247 RepID=UPI000836B19E|nr:hypothetical protein [Nocardia yamanashiensis]
MAGADVVGVESVPVVDEAASGSVPDGAALAPVPVRDDPAESLAVSANVPPGMAVVAAGPDVTGLSGPATVPGPAVAPGVAPVVTGAGPAAGAPPAAGDPGVVGNWSSGTAAGIEGAVTGVEGAAGGAEGELMGGTEVLSGANGIGADPPAAG